MKKLYIFLFALISNNVNAEWGEQWGSMVWGQSSANVPMIGGIGQFIFFFSLLAIGMLVIRRWSLIKALPIFVFFAFIPAMVDANEDQNPSDSDNDLHKLLKSASPIIRCRCASRTSGSNSSGSTPFPRHITLSLRLVLRCINTDFRNQIFIFQHFSRSTK